MKFKNYQSFENFLINVLDIDKGLIGVHILDEKGVHFEIEQSSSCDFIMRVYIDTENFSFSFFAEFDFNVKLDTSYYQFAEDQLITQKQRRQFFKENFESFEYEEV